jgi:hypothetical protein
MSCWAATFVAHDPARCPAGRSADFPVGHGDRCPAWSLVRCSAGFVVRCCARRAGRCPGSWAPGSWAPGSWAARSWAARSWAARSWAARCSRGSAARCSAGRGGRCLGCWAARWAARCSARCHHLGGPQERCRPVGHGCRCHPRGLAARRPAGRRQAPGRVGTSIHPGYTTVAPAGRLRRGRRPPTVPSFRRWRRSPPRGLRVSRTSFAVSSRVECHSGCAVGCRASGARDVQLEWLGHWLGVRVDAHRGAGDLVRVADLGRCGVALTLSGVGITEG